MAQKHTKNNLPNIGKLSITEAGRPATVKAPKLSIIHGDVATRASKPPPGCRTGTYKYTADQTKLNGDANLSVITNYVTVPTTPQQVYEYRIDITPISTAATGTQAAGARSVSSRGERKRVFNAIRLLAPLQGRNDFFTDYDTLWSCSELDINQLILSQVQYAKQSGRMVTLPSIQLFYMRTLNFSNGSVDLTGPAVLTGPTKEQRNPSLLIKALNGMVTKCITERQQNDLFEAGANSFYLKSGITNLPPGLLINRGYFTSVRPGQDSVLLNVNIMHGTFIKPQLVSTFLKEMEHAGYGDPKALLKGRTVRVIYERGTHDGVDKDDEANRKKQIAGFGDPSGVQEFNTDDGRVWTVKKWFEDQGIRLKSPDSPAVNVGLSSGTRPGGTGALWIPAELLEIEPYQFFGKMLNPAHMRGMIRTALKHPAANQAAIVEEGLPLLGIGNPNITAALASDLHLSIGTKLLQVPARILPAPTIKYLSTSKKDVTIASWDVAKDVFVKTPGLKLPIGVLDFRRQGSVPAADVGLGLLRRCKDHGIITTTPTAADVRLISPPHLFPGTNQASFDKWSTGIGKASGLKQPGEPLFVLVLLDQQDTLLYQAVKWFADCRAGWQTVVCTNTKFTDPGTGKLKQGNPMLSLFSNLALKVNVKCGGQNHALVQGADNSSAFQLLNTGGGPPGASPPAAAKSSSGPPKMVMPGAPKIITLPGKKPAQSNKAISPYTDTMVIGVDVVHPGGDTPSIASMVGSVDQAFANFPGSIRLQPGRVEILQPANVRDMFKERLAAFKKKNADPKRILYYRDGVSEDQYYQVLDQEIAAISQLLPKAAITVIVVGKRHNTRFFAPNDKMSYPDRRGPEALSGGPNINGNIKPGLLVEKVITQPTTNVGLGDFFLQSHAALAGTAKSAHYIVIRNDKASALDMPAIHNITHAFCYDYARATKGVSYCAPAYYADRLCDRAHKYLTTFMNVYQRGPKFLPPMTPDEKSGGQAGSLAYRTRVRDEMAKDSLWNHGRTNPWHPNLNDTMFWL